MRISTGTLQVFGGLAPGATLREANAELDTPAGEPESTAVPLEAFLEVRLLLPQDQQAAEEIDVRITHRLVVIPGVPLVARPSVAASFEGLRVQPLQHHCEPRQG